MPPADGSSTRGGSTSVRGRVRSLHVSGGRPAAGCQRAYSLGWDRQTDVSRYRFIHPLRRGYDNFTGTFSLIVNSIRANNVVSRAVIILRYQKMDRTQVDHRFMFT